jgi:hypothetical protein
VNPSTEWAEVVADDEDERHARVAEEVVKFQSRANRKHGPGRAFHRSPAASLKGRLTVHDGLPAHAAQGLFATPDTHEAVVRMSNGAIVPQPDAIPDVRGFAVSVRGLDAPGALGGRTDRQDFLLINMPKFGFRDTGDFVDLLAPAARSLSAVARSMIAQYGPVRGSLAFSKLIRDQTKPFSGYATAAFHSCLPVKWGPYAAQIHVEPVGARRNLMAWRDFGADIRDRIARGPLTWEVQAQFYTDPVSTPIENGDVTWRGEKIAVATLVCDELAEVEQDRFYPWAALEEHRPLGELMRARKVAMLASSRNR